MIFLFYTSKSKKFFNDQMMLELLEKSRDSNASKGLTGLLLYKSSVFLQYIEGPEKEVLELFKKIQSDPRHTDVKLISKGNLSENKRIFDHWSMAYKKSDEIDYSLYENAFKLIEGEVGPNDIIELMKKFYYIL